MDGRLSLQRYERIQMLEDAKKEKQALERVRQELMLSGSLRFNQLDRERISLLTAAIYRPFLSTSFPVAALSFHFGGGSPLSIEFQSKEFVEKVGTPTVTDRYTYVYINIIRERCCHSSVECAAVNTIELSSCWLTCSEETPHSDAGKCRAGEEYLGKG
jgi:hypothetical protein